MFGQICFLSPVSGSEYDTPAVLVGVVLGSWNHAEVEFSAKEVINRGNSRLQAAESEGKVLGAACTPKALSQTCQPRVRKCARVQ